MADDAMDIDSSPRGAKRKADVLDVEDVNAPRRIRVLLPDQFPAHIYPIKAKPDSRHSIRMLSTRLLLARSLLLLSMH